jgi:cytochrome P450/nitrite reductase/ring-hydroxylating ferredoxin subunit
MIDGLVRIASVSQLEEGNPIAAQTEGQELVVVKCDGAVTVLEGKCPHQGTMLVEGTVENGCLVCRGHGWSFDCGSGVKTGNPNIRLKTFAATIIDGYVMVNTAELLAWQQRAHQTRMPASERPPIRSLQQLPGPRGLPLLGNSLQLDLSQLHKILEQWSDTFGPIYKFNIGNKPHVVIAEPELISKILRDRPETYRRLGTIEPVLRELGVNGVFSAEGDDWRRQRRMVMYALDTKHLRRFFPTLRKVTQRLYRRWERSANDQLPVEAQKDLMRYTVDVTTNLAFGYDMNTLENEGDVIQEHLEKIFPMINRRIFAAFPYWRHFKLGADRSLNKSLAEIRKTVGEFIADSRTKLAQDPDLAQHPTNLLEAMLASADEDGTSFSEDEVFGNVFTMLLAGEDTTANTIAWMMYYLTEYPEVRRRLQEEVDAVLGGADMLPDIQAARKLVYLQAVVNETMRLRPVAPILAHDTNTDLDLAGVHLPKGTSLMLLTRPGVLQSQQFPEPTEFRPDRWLPSGPSRSIHHHRAFIPFGSGPRLCPGRSLALLEIKMAMAMLCRNFNVSSADLTGQVEEEFAFTMMPANLYVTLNVR